MRQRLPQLFVGLLLLVLVALPVFLLARSSDLLRQGQVLAVWGRRGVSEGRFLKPRAMAISAEDHLYVVDMTARIQQFDAEGQFVRSWQTPKWDNGKPSGLSFDRDGNLMVADTHYFRLLFYSPTGELLRSIGGTPGNGPGEFGLVTDAVQDSQGNYYIAEYGEFDRIQKFSRDGQYLMEWGGHGSAPGQFVRPQNLTIDDRDQIWVADACNHRIQVFDARGTAAKLIRCFGSEGSALGQLRYPYDLVLDGRGHLYVCEFGNDRVQKFTTDGRPVCLWGTSGREEGMVDSPWALVRDQRRRLHVLDTYNHRVQTIRL